jgi:cytochrome c biogenesis protein CcmG, thiol:disulfide interchange protein DsbE
MHHLARSLIASLVLAAGIAAHCIADDGVVKLQAKGTQREALDAISYKPFDGALWSSVDGWTGTPVNKETTAGKPVLIVAWASWYKTSHGALTEAQKIADGNKDLVVVAIHHAKGFDKAADVLGANHVTIPVAHDAQGAFFQGLHVPAAGPNYFVVDRAGNLRFADVEKGSVADAVKIVVDESAADAAKAPERLKEAQKSAGDAPMGGPQVKVHLSPEDYKQVKWPAVNKGVSSAKNLQGKPLPAKFGKEKWLSKEPNRDGKIVVLDFWATWCPPCRAAMPHLDDLYKKYSQNVVVIGISDEDESTVKTFIKSAKHSYPQAIDGAGTIKSAMGIEGIPHVVVLSTDGVIRWQGNPHPSADLPSLQETVAKLIEVDPGVKARQDREKKPG